MMTPNKVKSKNTAFRKAHQLTPNKAGAKPQVNEGVPITRLSKLTWSGDNSSFCPIESGIGVIAGSNSAGLDGKRNAPSGDHDWQPERKYVETERTMRDGSTKKGKRLSTASPAVAGRCPDGYWIQSMLQPDGSWKRVATHGSEWESAVCNALAFEYKSTGSYPESMLAKLLTERGYRKGTGVNVIGQHSPALPDEGIQFGVVGQGNKTNRRNGPPAIR